MSLITGPRTTGDPAETAGRIEVPAKRSSIPGQGCRDRGGHGAGGDSRGGTAGWHWALAAGGYESLQLSLSPCGSSPLGTFADGSCWLALEVKTLVKAVWPTAREPGSRRAVICRTQRSAASQGCPGRSICLHLPAAGHPGGARRGSLSSPGSQLWHCRRALSTALRGNLSLPSNHFHTGPR